jgi:hypothetical protein
MLRDQDGVMPERPQLLTKTPWKQVAKNSKEIKCVNPFRLQPSLLPFQTIAYLYKLRSFSQSGPCFKVAFIQTD